jgi:hypothetical protein
MCKALLASTWWISFPPDDILQPPGHGIHQVLLVQYASDNLRLLNFVTASATPPQKSQRPEILLCVYPVLVLMLIQLQCLQTKNLLLASFCKKRYNGE